jgi:hypothetical protein
MILVGSLLLCGGGVVAMRILTPRPNFARRLWAYLAFLLILLPATFYNYNQHDQVLSRGLQATLNLILIGLGAIAAIWLSDFRVIAPDAKVIKFVCIVLLIGSSILVPSLFTFIWASNQIGLLSLKQSKEISFANLTGISAVGSLVISWLNYRRELKKSVDVGSSSHIVH